MKELYWLSRLPIISDGAQILCILGIISLTGLVIGFFALSGNPIGYSNELKAIKKGIRISSVILILCGITRVFAPNKNEMLLILGVGSVIDLVQENKSLQELPDHCIKALDTWANNLLEEDERNNN